MRTRNLALVALLVVASATPALAQAVVSAADREAIRGVPDTWGVSVGSFWQAFDTKVQLNGETANGQEINLEKDLNLNKNLTNGQLRAFWRFGDRHRLDVTWIPWNRDHTGTIDKQIQWGDVIYDAGASVTVKSKINLADIVYKYDFYNNGKVNFGLNGGISALWSTTELSGEGTISGGGNASGTIAKSSEAILPVPVLGVHFEMTLAKRLFWTAEANYFAANVSGYNGSVSGINTTIEYFFTKNFGAGGGFASTRYNVKHNLDEGGGFRIRYGFSGGLAYLKLAF